MTPSGPPPQWGDMRPLQLLQRIAEDPVVGHTQLAVGRTLVDELDPRMLETIALRVGARRDCRYVWAGHTVIATNTGVLTVEEIARIADGPRSLSGDDAVLVRAVDELLDRRPGSSALDALGGDALRVLIATFFYDAVATLMRGVEPEPDAKPPRGLQTPALAVRTINRSAFA